MTPEERFWSKVDTSPGPAACWPWTGAITSGGYGSAWSGDRSQKAHRVAYTLAVGPIPDGLDIDHVCHNADPACAGGRTCLHRRCANPRHLEPATHRENCLRGVSPSARRSRATKCPNGHPYTPENTGIRPGGTQRMCWTCRREFYTKPTSCPDCGKVMTSGSLLRHMRGEARRAA